MLILFYSSIRIITYLEIKIDEEIEKKSFSPMLQLILITISKLSVILLSPTRMPHASVQSFIAISEF